MAAWTRARVASRTSDASLSTRETVWWDTPACFATSAMLGARRASLLPRVSVMALIVRTAPGIGGVSGSSPVSRGLETAPEDQEVGDHRPFARGLVTVSVSVSSLGA